MRTASLVVVIVTLLGKGLNVATIVTGTPAGKVDATPARTQDSPVPNPVPKPTDSTSGTASSRGAGVDFVVTAAVLWVVAPGVAIEEAFPEHPASTKVALSVRRPIREVIGDAFHLLRTRGRKTPTVIRRILSSGVDSVELARGSCVPA